MPAHKWGANRLLGRETGWRDATEGNLIFSAVHLRARELAASNPIVSLASYGNNVSEPT